MKFIPNQSLDDEFSLTQTKEETMAAEKKKDDEDDKVLQYELVANTYVRCGATVKTVPAGFYNVVNLGPSGYGLRPTEPASDELIDIPGTVADEIFDDIDTFLATKDAYASYNLTHKRGYLFYGPPGSGKTSLGLMLARRFVDKVGGIVMFVGDAGSLFHGVSILRDVEPGRPSLYLIEEADAVVNNTHCLSILDGELSIRGAVFVAMTNYKEKLPPRIANRPGRFDMVTRVDCPPYEVQLEYLRRVEGRVGDNPKVPERIVKGLRGLPVSMAHLREAFISHVLLRKTVKEIRARFDEMFKTGEVEGDQTAYRDDDEPYLYEEE